MTGLWAVVVVYLLRSTSKRLNTDTTTTGGKTNLSEQCSLMENLILCYEDVRNFWEKFNDAFMLLYGVAYGSDVTVKLGYVMQATGFTSSKKPHDVNTEAALSFFSQAGFVGIQILLTSIPLVKVPSVFATYGDFSGDSDQAPTSRAGVTLYYVAARIRGEAADNALQPHSASLNHPLQRIESVSA
ncbi:hypothetical protein RvY_14795 [Ramazzottius varieornatus]|uniref:Uncharacterized protein n=1 Tax=Ramazzottius varieornatus TaxID=947166 RepID=A0A1D1VUC2_RAMVA|nr:hypothetical protein RvY_14795 [Ramazzottius varieornatus]